MLQKNITYENPFTGAQVTEEHFFHISKADLVEMEMEEHKDVYTNQQGEQLTGMQAKLQRIVDSEDGKAILAEFKDMIRRSYGKRDGNRFLKSTEIWEEFASTEAFSQLLFELCTDANAASEFINGIIPNNLEQIADEVRQRATEAASANGSDPQTPVNDGDAGPRLLSVAEMKAMDVNELQSGLADGRYKLS